MVPVPMRSQRACAGSLSDEAQRSAARMRRPGRVAAARRRSCERGAAALVCGSRLAAGADQPLCDVGQAGRGVGAPAGLRVGRLRTIWGVTVSKGPKATV